MIYLLIGLVLTAVIYGLFKVFSYKLSEDQERGLSTIKMFRQTCSGKPLPEKVERELSDAETNIRKIPLYKDWDATTKRALAAADDATYLMGIVKQLTPLIGAREAKKVGMHMALTGEGLSDNQPFVINLKTVLGGADADINKPMGNC